MRFAGGPFALDQPCGTLEPVHRHRATRARRGAGCHRQRCALAPVCESVVSPRFGAHMSVAGGLPRAVERAVVHRCDALQIFAKNANQWRGRDDPARGNPRVSREGQRGRHRPGRLARQLPDQPRDDASRRCASSRSRRWATSSIAPRRSGCSAWCCTRAATRSGSEAEGLALIAEALLDLLRAAAPRQDDGAARAHGRPGHGARRHVRAARVDHRQDERPPARRRLPRYLSPARVGLRPLLAGRIRVDVHAVRPARRIRSAEGVSPQRLEEAARQPRRSPRAHRRGLPRPRAVPPPRQRPAVSRICRCCSRRRKKKAGSPAKIALDRFDERISRLLRGLCRGRGGQEAWAAAGRRSNVAVALPRLPYLPYPPCLPSPNTSASKLQIFAPCFQASRGRPALWHVCARNVSASQFHSVATCGSSRPRCQSHLDDQPVPADLDVAAGRRSARADRAARSRCRARRARSGVTGGKRGSVVPAATAQRGTTRPSGSSASMWPMQPRSSP